MANDQATTPLPPLVAGQIRFHQASPPALPPGDYDLTVNQSLKVGQDGKNASPQDAEGHDFSNTSTFTVAGPRFFLKPTEVYSVYPPKGHFGPFDNALPHVVFTRRTLPWERTLDGGKVDPDSPVPWMALVLLSPDDFSDGTLPSVNGRTVQDLLDPKPDPDTAGSVVMGPTGLVLDNGQDGSDLCNTIDIPIDLFTEIVPSIEDMPFLAHVREVKTGGKETLSLKQDGWFTVVLGNRLPQTTDADEGIKNLVCLVSLEGFKNNLPVVDAASGVPSVSNPKGADSVRMAVLATWNFTCYGHNDFKVRMTDLDDRSLLSLDAFKLTGDDDGSKAVNAAFELGYTGLNHTTRLGEKTVSWYRGPLIPLNMPLRSPYAFIPTADRALRYDKTGMFATEYASAYELGRMLALQNRTVASAMYRYRNSTKMAIEAQCLSTDLAKDFSVANLMNAGDTLEDAITTLFCNSKGLT